MGSDSVHTYTITDDDGPPTIDFNTTSSTGAEDISSVAITIDLSAASSNNITVNYAVTGTATGSGTDYTLADGTLTINAGATSGTITIASMVIIITIMTSIIMICCHYHYYQYYD